MNKQLFSNVYDIDFKVFYDNFSNAEDVFEQFSVGEEFRSGIDFIYAHYETPDYEGYAMAIFVKDGVLYEVNGSHCSCNGLEGQWEPEETSVIALLSRPNVPDAAKANLRKYYKNLMSFL